jgi:hypothetical protein
MFGRRSGNCVHGLVDRPELGAQAVGSLKVITKNFFELRKPVSHAVL